MTIKTVAAAVSLFLSLTSFAQEAYLDTPTKLPDIRMKQNGLPFTLIDGYPDYKIVATHFRTDKNELRYILANPVAYNALRQGVKPLPDGSKIVKIGWSVVAMPLYSDALEADDILRVEYMYKDASRFDQNGDHWGYARFVKKDGAYESWQGDINGCVSCHSVAKENDYLFTGFQKTF